MKIFLRDLAETLRMGQLLGSLSQDGDVFAVVGNLGAGKTSLAQGVASGLGVDSSSYVNSPTFTLHQRHFGRIPFHHIDLYRLVSGEEILNLGLRELVGIDGVSYVEWPSRSPSLIPESAVWLKLEFHLDGRALSFGHANDEGRGVIERVCKIAHTEFDVI